MLHPLLTKNQLALKELCRRYGVRSLEVFGSGVRADFDEVNSDFDFLFDLDSKQGNYFDTYFGLKEGLEDILAHSVDLLSEKAVKNPYFSRRTTAERILLYAA